MTTRDYVNMLFSDLDEDELAMLRQAYFTVVRVSTSKEERTAQKLVFRGYIKGILSAADWKTGQYTYRITAAGKRYFNKVK